MTSKLWRLIIIGICSIIISVYATTVAANTIFSIVPTSVPRIEYTALLRFIQVEEKLREKGIEVQLAALNPKALEIVR